MAPVSSSTKPRIASSPLHPSPMRVRCPCINGRSARIARTVLASLPAVSTSAPEVDHRRPGLDRAPVGGNDAGQQQRPSGDVLKPPMDAVGRCGSGVPSMPAAGLLGASSPELLRRPVARRRRGPRWRQHGSGRHRPEGVGPRPGHFRLAPHQHQAAATKGEPDRHEHVRPHRVIRVDIGPSGPTAGPPGGRARPRVGCPGPTAPARPHKARQRQRAAGQARPGQRRRPPPRAA